MIIAILALIISFFALGWNIIRDLIVDRVNLDVEATAGEIIPVAGIPTRAMFMDADADLDRVIKNPKIVFFITNTGRRPVVIAKIWGEYGNLDKQNKPFWILNTRELPKMVQPYERHSETAEDNALMREIWKGNVPKIWVEDTKGKKWSISRKNMKRLKKTVATLPNLE